MRTTLASAFLLVSIILGGTACSNQNQAENKNNEKGQPKAITVSLKEVGLSIGDVAPDFKLEHVDGTFFTLADIKDANDEKPKGYIVVFTCNTCPFSVKYEDRLIELHHKMAAKGYPVVAIQPNDPILSSGNNMSAMQERAKEKAFPFLYLMDAEQEIAPQYGAGRTPEVYLLDQELVLQYHGAIDDNAQNPNEVSINYVEHAIEALENEETPNPAEVKAIGCSIKNGRR